MSIYFNIIKWIVVVYLLFMGMFYLILPNYYPSLAHSLFQIGESLLILFFAYFLLRKDISIPSLTIGLMFYLVILIGSYRLFNYSYLGNWLAVGVDGKTYTRVATEFASGHYPLSFLLGFFKQKQIMFDDYGMCSITSFVFWFFGSHIGFHLLPFFSIIPILTGGYLLMKICKMYVADEQLSMFLYFVWCTMTYSAYNCSVGLKENYMVCLVITSVYFLCRCTHVLSLPNIAFFALFASSLLLFRTALCYMLFASLLAVMAMKLELFGRRFIFWFVLAVVASILLFSTIVDYIGDIRGGTTSEGVRQTYQRKMSLGGFFAPVLNIIVTLVGPIPSFVSDPVKVKYMTLFSFSSTLKLILSFGYLYSVYYAFKHKLLNLMPIIIFVFLHSLMIWSMFYSLHDRYQWPQYPFVLFLSLYGLKKFHRDYPGMTIYKCYCVFAMLCIFFFNFRFI